MKCFPALSARLFFAVVVTSACAVQASGGWPSFAGDGDFVPARRGLKLTSDPVNIRLDWKNPTHTGQAKGGGGTALEVHRAGFEPAYGEIARRTTAAAPP